MRSIRGRAKCPFPDGRIAARSTALRCAVRADPPVAPQAGRAGGSQVHLLSALLPDLGVNLAQREVAAKTNQIPELPQLLLPIELTDRLVSADGLHIVRETVRYLIEDKKAH